MKTPEQIGREYDLAADGFERTNPFAVRALNTVAGDGFSERDGVRAQVNATLALAFEEFKSRRART